MAPLSIFRLQWKQQKQHRSSPRGARGHVYAECDQYRQYRCMTHTSTTNMSDNVTTSLVLKHLNYKLFGDASLMCARQRGAQRFA